MNRYKVCVYAICKNEEAFVERWMASMGEADAIVVTDTGSADGTVAALRAAGAIVHSEVIRPWRFDEARNRSLAHVPEDADICVCTDLDETFRPGWRRALEAAWSAAGEPDGGNYLYNWSLRPDGSPDVQFTYFKVHARQGYRWVCPVHECLRYTGSRAERRVFIDGMVLDHRPDPAKSRSSYLPLLEMAVAEDPASDRMAYYLGREYLYAGRWADCVRELTRYLALPTARWNDERCAAMRWIAKACSRQGDYGKAAAWYFRAIAEQPAMRDAYVELAMAAYERRDWPTVAWAAEEALKIEKKSQTFVNQGYAWDHTPHDFAALGCTYIGLPGRAADHAERALALKPDDERLRENLRVIRRMQDAQSE